MSEYLLIALPNSLEGTSSTWRLLERALGVSSGKSKKSAAEQQQQGATEEAAIGELYHLDLPTLRVGTLEKLMSSGDVLSKADSMIETIIRKIERAFSDVNTANETLTIEEGQNASTYLQNFRWSTAKYQSTRPIEELINLVNSSAQKIDDELKQAHGIYNDKKQILAALERKKGPGNLLSSFDEIAKIDPAQLIDSEFLTTVCVVVSKNMEQMFLNDYERYCADAVGYGPPEDRQSVLGSPVVPRSAVKVQEDKDGYVLYLVTVLKNYKKDFEEAVKAARCNVREYKKENNSGDAAASVGVTGGEGEKTMTEEEKISLAQQELKEARTQLKRWAKTHYGEAFIAWMHLKAIRVFVEAVLLYGLPVDFCPALIRPLKSSSEKKIRENLEKLYEKLMGSKVGEFASSTTGGAEKGEAFYPYVSFTFKPLSHD